MSNRVADFAADHRYVLEQVARAAGFTDPVAFDPDEFRTPLLRAAQRGPFVPIDGVLIRDWDPDFRWSSAGVTFGARLYRVHGIRFARAECSFDYNQSGAHLRCFAVERQDYARLYKLALRLRQQAEPTPEPPVMTDHQRQTLWQNTVGFLEPAHLDRIKAYGGRAKRGVLLTGPPGNGKTFACRWLRQECLRHNWECRVVTPDAYAEARRECGAEAAVRALFEVERTGIVFFDDLDIALRDRETVKETDDQAVFLGALDGIRVNEGVAFVFTTNCSLDLIDRAFKRPGRIDVVLEFDPPDTDLRRRLFDRWHAEIRAAIDAERVFGTTDGLSFAEIEEIKNLLILHFMETSAWDWDWALHQLHENRRDPRARKGHVGFCPVAETNGEVVEPD